MRFKFKIEFLVGDLWQNDIIEFEYIPVFAVKVLELGATKWFIKELIKGEIKCMIK